jgi:hypothetical protein
LFHEEDIMKRLSLAFLVVLVSVVALTSALTTALAAPATKEPFSATLQITEYLGYERGWMDEEGINHFRGWSMKGNVSGDINGTIEIIENANMDMHPSGNLDVQLKGVITVSGEEAYRITADLTIESGVISSSNGNFVLHGMGSFKGIHITGTITVIDLTHSLLTGTKLTTKP